MTWSRRWRGFEGGSAMHSSLKSSAGPGASPAGMGSFDCARLAPHFAQDDSD
jgi:hypothetical protein